MKLLRRRAWRYGRRATILLITAAVVVLAGGGAVLARLGGFGSSVDNASDSVNLQKGLVGWWKLDNNLKDSTPNATVCSYPFSSPVFTSDRKGRALAALSPTSHGAECGQPTALQVANVTVSAWVNSSSYNSSGNGIESFGGVVQFYLTTSGNLEFAVHDSLNNFHSFISPATYALNTWYHVAATYDGSNVVLYVNGSPVSTASYTTGIGTNHYGDAGNQFMFGNYGSNSTTRTFQGAIDDVRYYNRALSAAEIAALYRQYDTSTKTATGEVGLVGWWKLNGNLSDSTPYATACTPQFFTPSYAVDRHGIANQALDLSGGSTLGADCGTPSVLKDSNTTISAWVKPTAWGSNIEAVAGWGTTMIFYFTSDGHLEFQTHDTSNIPHSFTSPSTYALNQWYHVAVTYDGTNLVLYVNGSAISTTAYSSGIGTSYEGSGNDFGLGGDGSSTDGFIGSLADIRVYNRALTSAEIQQQYNAYNSQISLGGDGGTSSVSINLQKGLVGYWPMNGNAKDATPYSNNGVFGGSPVASLTQDRKGRAGSAYSFNGTNDYITMSASTYPDINAPASTVAWINVSNTSTVRDIVDRFASSGNPAPGIQFRLTTGGALQLTSSGEGLLLTGNTALSTGQWYMVAYTFDGTTANLYINGNLDKSGSITPQVGTTAFFLVGSYGSGEYFAGSIDDVRIYNRALNASEVQALYNEYQ